MEAMMNIEPGDLVELQALSRRYDTNLKLTVFKTGEMGVVTNVATDKDAVFVDVLLPQGILNTLDRLVKKVEVQ
jgi:hypothetical protein